VLVERGLIVRPQHVVALGSEVFVMRLQPHLLPMRLDRRRLQHPLYIRVVDVDALPAQVTAEKATRPMRNRNTYVARLLAGCRLDDRDVDFGKRETGRPERGASTSLSLGASHAKRTFHRRTVRKLTPSSFATSAVATPSAISSNACARLTTLCSALAGLHSASTFARSATDNGNATVAGPRCGRFAHGSLSIMSRRVSDSPNKGQISDARH